MRVKGECSNRPARVPLNTAERAGAVVPDVPVVRALCAGSAIFSRFCSRWVRGAPILDKETSVAGGGAWRKN